VVTILAFFVVLGILVFVHEAGHFAAAKMSPSAFVPGGAVSASLPSSLTP
jgi:hypothetical protein